MQLLIIKGFDELMISGNHRNQRKRERNVRRLRITWGKTRDVLRWLACDHTKREDTVFSQHRRNGDTAWGVQCGFVTKGSRITTTVELICFKGLRGLEVAFRSIGYPVAVDEHRITYQELQDNFTPTRKATSKAQSISTITFGLKKVKNAVRCSRE
ncbi:hypothetical protein CLF_104132 [Clonorchis sinensis]|uniref:Envelope glycoprotein E central and dimerisation domain-containing protein n=1 Tax=Clonorchis sinensis TaxID=79923 RepID=G7YB21_CLOSI|nr:hypothetical protein CLF_104132 [Clonorchis sinensis]